MYSSGSTSVAAIFSAANWDFDVEFDDWLTSNRIAHYMIENGLEAQ